MNAERVIAELRELDARSGGRRVAWTETWATERRMLADRLADELGLGIELDEVGNLWVTLPGQVPGTVIVGSHVDCVPDGGWLGVLSAAELARELSQVPAARRRTLAVVDWADEEGAQSGHSLLGSSAACGMLDLDLLSRLETADGEPLVELLRRNGVDPASMHEASARLADAVAYLELHIEQGPVLEAAGRACAAVSGCLGVETVGAHDQRTGGSRRRHTDGTASRSGPGGRAARQGGPRLRGCARRPGDDRDVTSKTGHADGGG